MMTVRVRSARIQRGEGLHVFSWGYPSNSSHSGPVELLPEGVENRGVALLGVLLHEEPAGALLGKLGNFCLSELRNSVGVTLLSS